MDTLFTIQTYLDCALKESESESKASGVRCRSELQKIIKSCQELRKGILDKHKKKKELVNELIVVVKEIDLEEVKEPVEEVKVEPKKKVSKKILKKPKAKVVPKIVNSVATDQ
jgi:hypothetical protein